MTAQFQTEPDLIRKAYIEPIRSVLIIDDQYPTWDVWLSGKEKTTKSAHGNEHVWANFRKIKSLIDNIREMNPARIVDIHNGNRDDANFKDYMHQSDLLILDYELKPELSEGEKFLKIVQGLLENSDHFNLILTHTNKEDLSEPFAKLLRSFLKSYDNFSKNLCDKGDEILEEFENSEIVKNSIGHEQFAIFRDDPSQAKKKALNREVPFIDFSMHCDSKNLDKKQRIALFMSSLKQYETRFRYEFRREFEPKGLAWSTSEPFWIKTNRGFIAFAGKSDGLDVISALKNALVSWNPTPSRLLSARLRAEIDSQGGIFEEGFLSDKHVAWMFYQELRNACPDAFETNLRKEIQRQMEHYTDAVSDNLINFGKEIVSSDTNENGNESQHSRAYNIDFSINANKNKALDNFNSFVSCTPRSGNHLIPGHIISIGNGELWVVLSPACDLVPDRRQPRMHFMLDSGILPFTAVHLFSADITEARNNATSTNYVFLRQDNGDIKTYKFYGSGDDDVKKAPQYKTFFANNGGRFDQDGKFQIIICSRNSGMVEETSEEVTMHNRQLRYEYALNLMAKLSAHTNRIGLEFKDLRFFD